MAARCAFPISIPVFTLFGSKLYFANDDGTMFHEYTVPYDRVTQIHLAGHTDKGTHCVDTHSRPVVETVWGFYADEERRTGGRATILEWDDDIPSFARTFAELKKAAPFKRRARRAAA